MVFELRDSIKDEGLKELLEGTPGKDWALGGYISLEGIDNIDEKRKVFMDTSKRVVGGIIEVLQQNY